MVTVIITGYLDKRALAFTAMSVLFAVASVKLSVVASMAILCRIVHVAAGLSVLGIHDVILRFIFDCLG